MSIEQNPHRENEPVQSTVEIPTPTAAYPAPYPTASDATSADVPSASSTTSATEASLPSDAAHDTPGSAPDAVTADPLVRTGPRSSTVVWGVVVVAVALGFLARAAGAGVDAQLGAIVLLAVAGVALVGTSVTGAARRRRKQSAAR